MSVSARIKQYGAMRAVGMGEHQVTKMIAAEAFTYAVSGFWRAPVGSLAVIILFVVIAAIVAVYAPTRRIGTYL